MRSLGRPHSSWHPHTNTYRSISIQVGSPDRKGSAKTGVLHKEAPKHKNQTPQNLKMQQGSRQDSRKKPSTSKAYDDISNTPLTASGSRQNWINISPWDNHAANANNNISSIPFVEVRALVSHTSPPLRSRKDLIKKEFSWPQIRHKTRSVWTADDRDIRDSHVMRDESFRAAFETVDEENNGRISAR